MGSEQSHSTPESCYMYDRGFVCSTPPWPTMPPFPHAHSMPSHNVNIAPSSLQKKRLDEEALHQETNVLLLNTFKTTSSLSKVVYSTLLLSIVATLGSWRILPNLFMIRDTPSKLMFRSLNNLIYWTPHKTGSTSMLFWLNNVISQTGLELHARDSKVFAFTAKRDWHDLALMNSFHNLSSVSFPHCSIVLGHIRALPYSKRRDERELGAVITTTRNGRDTLTSKYFHRRSEKVGDLLDEMSDVDSTASRSWFFYFNDIDACEVLRYYDGIDGCDLDRVVERARRISSRIDCVVDTEDPEPDIQALCSAMHVAECPAFPKMYSRSGKHGYTRFYKIPHIKPVMERALFVTNALRQELLKKNCRLMVSQMSQKHHMLFPNPECAIRTTTTL